MTTVRQDLNDIYAPIQRELGAFSDVLKKELKSEDSLIRSIHEHLLKISGKSLRPALAILSSKVGGNGRPQVATLAAAIELIHTATLVHDDIIDDSPLRRNQPTVYSKWGGEISIVSGDYLYAKAFLLLASLKDTRVNEAFARCAHVMCEGEMKQIEKRAAYLMSEPEYLKIIHQKTAALFEAACVGGGYFSEAGDDTIRRLGAYGRGLGMAFQIVDDCLDIVGETESFGKTRGLDLTRSDVTLPVLYLFQSMDQAGRDALLARLKEGAEGTVEYIRERLIASRSVDRAMDRARAFVDESLEQLRALGGSTFKDSLMNLASYCVDRVR